MALCQGLGPYKRGRETRKRLAKTIARERKEPKQSTKERRKTIYRNTIQAGPTLERYIRNKRVNTDSGKRDPKYSIVNTIGGKCLRALRRPNKGRKYNSNTSKDRNNKIKKLALLSGSPSRQPKV